MKRTFFLPIKTVSEANQREHWGAKARRAKAQRTAAGLALRVALRGVVPPVSITLTRHVGATGRKLDKDNLAGSMKHVQDGIADALGIDDGSELVRWEYLQERPTPPVWGVLVHVCDAKGAE